MARVADNNTMTNFIIQERVKRFLADGKFEEAEKYYLKSLKFKEQAYGKDDPSLLPLLKEIASYYEHINEDEKALEFIDRCEKIEGFSLETEVEIKVDKKIKKSDISQEAESEGSKSKEVFIYKKVEDTPAQEPRRKEEREIESVEIIDEPSVEITADIKQNEFPKSYYLGQIARVLDNKGDVSDQISDWAMYPGKMILQLGKLKPPVNTPHDKLLINIMSSVSPFEPSDLSTEKESSSDNQVAFWMGYYSKEAVIS